MSRFFSQPALDSPPPTDGASGAHPVRNPAAGGAEQAFFRLDVIRSLQLHRTLAIGVALLFVALAVAYVFRVWPVYIAQSLVYVQPAPHKVLQQGGGEQLPYDGSSYETYFEQQMLSVTRTDVLASALHKLDPFVWQHSGENDQVAAGRLAGAIEVTRVGGGYEFSVAARASDPVRAADLSNAVTASYVENAAREQKSGDAQRLAALENERNRIQQQLTADRTEQEALNKLLGVASIATAAPDHYDDDIGKVRTELVKARTDHDLAQAQLSAIDGGGQSANISSAALDAEADELSSSDAGLVAMKTSLNQRRAALVSQMANLTPNHPQYKQDEAELAQINKSLDSMARELRSKAAARIQQRLRTDAVRTAAVESQLYAQLGQLTGAAGSATGKLQRSSDLATDIARLQARFGVVDEQWHNLKIEDSAPGAAYVITAAMPPSAPNFKVLRKPAVLAMAGLLFGLIAAVLANKIDPRVYIASDVQHVLGYAPMAQLPDFDEVSGSVGEEYLLRLAAAIEFARQQGNLKSLIFTGAGPGAGTTTVSTRVKEMLETMGRETVLVDASRTPAPASRDFADLGNSNGNQALVAQRGNRPAALQQQVAEEAERQDESLVLTDAAPLLVSAETEYLARFVDCAIVVIQSGVTTRNQLREVATSLQRLDVAAVGFVLNRVGLAKADPSFRASVRAMETHIHTQTRSVARHAGWTHAAVEPAEVAPPALPTQHENLIAAGEQVPTAIPKPTPDSVYRPSRQTAAEPAYRPANPTVPAPASIPPTATHPVKQALQPAPAFRAEEPIEGAPDPQAVLNWALDPRQALPLKGTPLQSAPLPRLHPKPPAPAATPVARPTPPAASLDTETPQPEPARAELPPAEIPTNHVAGTPVQSWERLSDTREEPREVQQRPSAEPPEPPKPVVDDPAAQQASRLSGLRDLLSALHQKNLQKGIEFSDEARVAEVKPSREAERYVYPRSFSTPLEQSPASRPSPPSAFERQVVAQPEFLPPRPPEDAPAKSEPKENAAARRDRRDNFDEVAILPSWRGQYKKKSR